jgi:hypothetical protein
MFFFLLHTGTRPRNQPENKKGAKKVDRPPSSFSRIKLLTVFYTVDVLLVGLDIFSDLGIAIHQFLVNIKYELRLKKATIYHSPNLLIHRQIFH